MSIQAVAMCLDFPQPTWSTGTQLVAIALADRVNSDSNECWPSIADIARRTRMTERNVQRHIRILEADGTITRIRRTQRADGLLGSNVWRWNLWITMPSRGDTHVTSRGDIHVTPIPQQR